MLLGWLPKSAYGIVHELTRHILKRPVVGVAGVCRQPDGKIQDFTGNLALGIQGLGSRLHSCIHHKWRHNSLSPARTCTG